MLVCENVRRERESGDWGEEGKSFSWSLPLWCFTCALLRFVLIVWGSSQTLFTKIRTK